MPHTRFNTACIIAAFHIFCPAIVYGSEISFQAVGEHETQLTAIMQQWHDAELKRQGGEFQSHGWWPWGLRAFDFDRDGDLDLIASHHGIPGSMIIESHFRTTGKLSFSDATGKPGIDGRDLPGADDRPWIWDFNGDGFLDIGGMSDERAATIVLNEDGKKFIPLKGVSFKPLAHPREILDLDGDGYLDVDGGYRGQWFFQPEKKTFRHVKESRFDHLASVPIEIRDALTELKHKKNNRFLRSVAMTHMIDGYDTLGYSPAPIDLNADRIGDLVVQTSGGYGADYQGHYLIGASDGTFSDATDDLGLPVDGAPIWIDDLTGDRFPDVLIAGNKSGGVYVHNGRDRFERVEGRLTTFLQKRGPYLLRAFRIDADNDADWDIVMTNPRLSRVEVFENKGDGNFVSLFEARGWDSNSAVIADMNSDGKMDVVVGTRDRSNQASITVFLNQTAAVGNFLRVYFKMPAPNPFAVGTVLNASVADESKTRLIEKAHWDGSPIHVGHGDVTECRLSVRFPDGKTLNSDSIRATTTVTADHTRGFLELPVGSGRD